MSTKVLIIDDHVPSGKTLAWAMETVGYDVHFVTNGSCALKEIDSFIPDVVLCDINMPGMTGYDVCKKMKSDSRLSNTLFLAQTGLSTHENKELSLQAGFHYHLVKPVDLDKLFDIVAADQARKQ